MFSASSEPLNQTELEFVDAMLHKYATDSSILNVSELDGFLTALVSGPNMVLPSQWMPAIWSSDEKDESPTWEGDDEFSRFASLVMQHMNSNIEMLMDANEEFEAIFMEIEENGDIQRLPDDWCLGYLRGMAVSGGWEQLPQEYEKYLMAIGIHTDPDMEEELEKLDEETRHTMIGAIEPAAQILHGYWLEQRMHEPGEFIPPPQTVQYDQPKVGRNDPCPCGSGKKFKKCCLH
ncbi:MAG: UPF0149 family protein [Pseudomonadota bacterium]|nr:UPF0149 family protein [Pseudomonadota bacterium]